MSVDEKALKTAQKAWHERDGNWKDFSVRTVIEVYEAAKEQPSVLSVEEAARIIQKEVIKSDGIDSDYTTYDACYNAANALRPYIRKDQPVESPEKLENPFDEIWKGLETIQHKLHDKYNFDFAAIKKVTADTHALCRPYWDEFHSNLPMRESGSPKLSACYVALKRLVDLKAYKDKNGKDMHYQDEHPYAWQQAKCAVNDIEGGASDA